MGLLSWFRLKYGDKTKASSREIRREEVKQEIDEVMRMLQRQDTTRSVSMEEIQELTKDQIPDLKPGDKLVAKASANGIYRITKEGTQVEVFRVISRDEALRETCGADDYPRDFEVILTNGVSFTTVRCNSKFFERVQ